VTGEKGETAEKWGERQKKAKFALRAKVIASKESSWRTNTSPQHKTSKQTNKKKIVFFWENGMNAAQSNKELDA
jgi:hypothetical protein